MQHRVGRGGKKCGRGTGQVGGMAGSRAMGRRRGG